MRKTRRLKLTEDPFLEDVCDFDGGKGANYDEDGVATVIQVILREKSMVAD
jgi:hypothetical protein